MSKATINNDSDKEIEYEFIGFNVKVLPVVDNPEANYRNLISKIFDKRLTAKVGPEKRVGIFEMDSATFPVDGKEYEVLMGTLVKFTFIGDGDWKNFENKESEQFKVPSHLIPPGYIETQFLFIPKIHRLYVSSKSKIPKSDIISFLKKTLDTIIDKEYQEVFIDQLTDKDTITKIVNSQKLLSLHVEISYTNYDLSGSAAEIVHKLYKDSNVGKAKVDLQPVNKNGLNTDATLVEGLVELAKENGEAKATIVNQDGHQEDINTKQHPEKFKLFAKLTDNIMFELFKLIIRKRKNDERGSV